MKKYIAIILTGVISLSLVSCGKEAEEVAEPVASEVTEIVEESSQADVTEVEETVADTAVVDDSEFFEISSYITEDWQTAYKEILDKYRSERSVPDENLMAGDDRDISGYFLFDCSGDDIPELIVRTGNCEAAYMDKIYSYNGKEVVSSEEYGAGHTVYYSNPNEAGAVRVYGHMGYQGIDSFYYDGKTIDEKELFTEDLSTADYDAEYTKVSDIVAGAEYLSQYPFSSDLPLAEYAGRTTTVDPSMKADEVEKFLDDIASGKADEEVVPVHAEHFRNPLEAMAFSELLKAGNLYEYATDDAVVQMTKSADLNGDGQSELILNMGNSGIAVLSRQNGRTYAYILNYYGNGSWISVEGDVIKSEDTYSSPIRLHFNKEQAYYEYVE